MQPLVQRCTAATWWLEYGPTTAYGSKSAAQSLPATTNDLDVGVNVTGLNSGTLYHARLVISNALGTVPGDDLTFTMEEVRACAIHGAAAHREKLFES